MQGEKRKVRMRYPLWAVNSLLFFLVLFALIFIWFTQEKISRRGIIEPREYRVAVVTGASKINITKIYEHDLFDTYRELPKPPPPQPLEPPRPPTRQPARITPKEKPSFLEPLAITLKGIIIVSQDDARNLATIADNKTEQEAVYKIGDSIEDAQLIRIFRNKVVFVRSNGQQEILYLRERDAKTDPAYALLGSWENVIEKKSDAEFSVDPRLFAERVLNLAQFIDIMDLTTAYKRGKSIGCRVGAIVENSLGAALGLHSGDIILAINTIPVTDSENRYAIYKAVIVAKLDDIIKVRILRMGQAVEISYILQEHKQPEVALESGQIITDRAARPEEVKEKEVKSMRERYTFRPTIEQIRAREKENMLRRGRKPKQSIAE